MLRSAGGGAGGAVPSSPSRPAAQIAAGSKYGLAAMSARRICARSTKQRQIAGSTPSRTS
eukprot:3726882-Pleurochrysis_carterae.AAC.3